MKLGLSTNTWPTWPDVFLVHSEEIFRRYLTYLEKLGIFISIAFLAEACAFLFSLNNSPFYARNNEFREFPLKKCIPYHKLA